MPLLDDPGHQELIQFLRQAPSIIRIKPEAIVVISAHWEENIIHITSNANPALIYDYSGFPEEAYQIEYPAVGNPKLAQCLFDTISRHGISAKLDPVRGFDHGLFVPLKLMYPDADIPCVQISLNQHLIPEDHLALGKALSSFKDQNILFLGSGFSFHNLPAFLRSRGEEDPLNLHFESWLNVCCTNQTLSQAEREKSLANWENIEGARYCHPRSEHLIPLHFCMGLAGEAGIRVFDGKVLDKKVSAFLWANQKHQNQA